MAVIKIGDILKAKGLAKDAQINIALIQQNITGQLLGDVFVKLGFVSSMELGQALAEQAGMDFIDLSQYPVSEEALMLIPKNIADNTGFIPIELTDGRLMIGITNPSNIIAIDKVTSITKQQPKVCMVDTEHFRESLDKGYFFLENPIQANIDKAIEEVKTTGTAVGQVVATITDLIMMDGVRHKATDIHINPAEEIIHIFYRIEGVLQYGHGLPKAVISGIVSRIKILSKLDISETRLPQDGSFTYEFLKKKYDIRVSCNPTFYGENVVMRVLAGSAGLQRIDKLGFSASDVKRIKALFQKPYGIILIAGPTGSGKTTTLYSALREIDLLERNVLTVEDPVEYKLSLVKQSQVNEKAGYTYASATRSFMRQDPDVMLIGEIRDEDTAMISVRSAITGHLVLSTIHTNDAVTSVPRLLDLKVDKYLMSSALLAVIAQRLARKICTFCKTEYTLSDEERKIFEEYGVPAEKGYRGSGCEKCGGKGYAGRVVFAEVFVVDDEIKDLIFNNVPMSQLRSTAMKKGMCLIKTDGLIKAAQGITTIDEVIRVSG